MCRDCRWMATQQIAVLIDSGLTAEIAIRVERDMVVQRCLKDKVGQDAIDSALELSEIVEQEGQALITIRDTMPSVFPTVIAAYVLEAKS
jgi:nickel-dependent lactate racemase